MPKLPLAADAVADDEVDLWTVKRRFAKLRLAAGQVHLARHLLDRRLGPVPSLGAADVLVAGRVAEPQPGTVVCRAPATSSTV